MRSYLLALSVLCLCIFAAQASNYAVLIAPSKGFGDYSDQATIYHAYHALIKNGLNPENIIVFAYDDIATHHNNPFPGKVFSKPSSQGGADVYKGVKIDYRGKDVSAKNFLAVLQGDSRATGGKKVLETTEDDNIFILMNDHGGRGLICFHDFEYLYADDLIDALKNMHRRKMYKKLVFYLDACQSGSMFEDMLPTNLNIYAATSASPFQPAYMTYCPSSNADLVNGQSVGTCLSSEFTSTFIERLEKSNLSSETLFEQLEHIIRGTANSEVQRYGDLTIQQETSGHFHANLRSSFWKSHSRESKGQTKGSSSENVDRSRDIDTRSRRLVYRKAQQKKNPSKKNAMKLTQEMNAEKRLDDIFKKLKQKFGLNVKVFTPKVDFPCLKARMTLYAKHCGHLNEYGMRYVDHIHQTCKQHVKDDLFEFVIEQICAIHKPIEVKDE